MKNKKFCVKILFAMIFFAFISPVFSSVTPTNIEILKSMGIAGPFSENLDATISYSFKLENYSKERVDKYVVLNFEGYDAKINAPGYPTLPYDVQVIELPSKCVIENVSVDIASVVYRVESVERKVMPSHQPLYYSTAMNQSIVYEENEEIYARDRYFPGCLVKYSVGYGSNGETILTLHLYPLQYNPATYNLAIFESFKVLIKYTLVQYQGSSEEMVIITTPWLIEEVQPLADYYNSTLGITTKIENTDNIYGTYPPAENITEFLGFYTPFTYDSEYSTLRSKYNWTLALKIISYVNQTNPKNVLLVGSANDVPPSFYYQSSQLSSIDSWEGWIPTDYFYASADYDLIPERSVGRIPFSDSASVQKAVSKILSWYSATFPMRPDWMRDLFMAGGYPFGLTYMFGESAISSISFQGYTQMFNTTLLTRTDENYNRSAIQNILRNGGAGWLFVLSHGSGVSLVDYTIVDYTFSTETLANIIDLYTYTPNNNLPVVSSVACTNGAWDESILSPPFSPLPSFGESLLTSNAAGIAYIGSARSAFEVGMYFSLDEGLLNTEFYGATMLHTMILKAYNQFMGTRTSVSLGEVFIQGLKDYVNTVVPLFDPSILDYVYANIFMLNIIGDPGLQLPVYESPFSNERINDVDALNIDASIESSYTIQVGGLTNGTLPIFKLFREASIRINATGEKLGVRIVKTYFSGPYLYGYESVAAFETPIYSGEANVTITTNRTLNGLMLFKIKAKGVQARFYVISAGLSAQYSNPTPGSMVHVEIFGLNVIPAYEAYLTIGGWSIAYIPLFVDGFAELDFVIPLFNSGTYLIATSFIGPMPPPPEVSALFEQQIVLAFPDATRLSVIAASGTQYEPGDTVRVRIAVVLNDVLTDANLTVNLITPNQVEPLSYQHVNVGEYLVSFLAPSTPGTYFVSVKAEVCYTLPAFNATAYTLQAFTVTLSFEELKALIQSGNDAINVTLTQISEELVEIQTTLGTVEGHIEEINNSTATIVSELGNITLTLDGIQRLISDAKGEVIAEVGTKFGSLSLTLEQLNGTIVQISDKTVEIRTLLDTIMGNITETKNGVVSIQTDVGNIEVTTNKIAQEQLPLSMEVLWATFGIAVIAVAILVTLTVWVTRKLKPKP